MVNQDEIYYWLVGSHDVVKLECIEITHPAFSKAYRFVRNHADGITVKHENGIDYFYDFLPISIQPSKSSDNLMQGFTIGIGDVGTIMPNEIQRLRDSQYATRRPVVNYRVYLSNDLNSILTSVLGLEVTDFQRKKTGAVFSCKAKETNKTSTGVKYTLDKFPTLRPFL